MRKTMVNEVMATMMVMMAQETPQAIGVMTMVVKQKNDPRHLSTTGGMIHTAMKEKKRKTMANKVMATMMVMMAQETLQAIGVMTMLVKQKNDP